MDQGLSNLFDIQRSGTTCDKQNPFIKYAHSLQKEIAVQLFACEPSAAPTHDSKA